MDDDFDVLLDCDCYGRGFIFSCTLCEDSNHRQDGYEIKIIVHAASSDLLRFPFFSFFDCRF